MKHNQYTSTTTTLIKKLSLFRVNKKLLFLATNSKTVFEHLTKDLDKTVEKIEQLPKSTLIIVENEPLSIPDLITNQLERLFNEVKNKENKITEMSKMDNISILVRI